MIPIYWDNSFREESFFLLLIAGRRFRLRLKPPVLPIFRAGRTPAPSMNQFHCFTLAKTGRGGGSFGRRKGAAEDYFSLSNGLFAPPAARASRRVAPSCFLPNQSSSTSTAKA